MPFHKILCAVDFSEPSRAAMKAAAGLAADARGALTLLNVVELTPMIFPESMVTFPTVLAEVTTASRQALDEWVAAARALAGGAQVEGAVATGPAWDRIGAEAKARGCDLIVVGTQGRTGLKHVLIGSVAERVVRHAPCPVLVVRD
jgi:nucleotide-binding universal stress UspA family protein